MRNRHAKILATLGPASRAPDTLRLLHDVGVDAFRLNFSHGSHEDHAASVKNIRDVQKSSGNPICIVADMQGPKLRCGSFEDGKIELRYGLPMSAMTEKDRVDMAFALTLDIDYIALSFVQTSKDVSDAREIIGDKAGIIVKIEKPSAVEDLDSILAMADAAMVARGDLGVELPLEDVPAAERDPIFWEYFKSIQLPYEATAEDAISGAVRGIATKLNVKAVLGYTLTGTTVQRISRERPPCHIVGLTPNMETASRLALRAWIEVRGYGYDFRGCAIWSSGDNKYAKYFQN